MSTVLMIVVDLIAISCLVFVLYYRRHRRRDLVTAFMVINTAVLGVAMLLGSDSISMGMGLGIFGALSIIRLRSSAIAQHEVAYYFAALAIGLIAGFNVLSPLLNIGLIALIMAVVAVVDSPKLLSRTRYQQIRVDRAIADEAQLKAHVEQMLGGTVYTLDVVCLDMVNDITTVDVSWRVSEKAKSMAASAQGGPAVQPADGAGA